MEFLKDGLYQVTTPYLCGGIVVENGEVTICAPILRSKLAYWKTQATLVQPKMKLIVAGSRTYNNQEELYEILDNVHANYPISQIVCGGAKGADLLGKRWADKRNIPVSDFPANWDLYGKSAGYKRNMEMGRYADKAIVFRVGESKGSTHMINIMHKLNKPVAIIQR